MPSPIVAAMALSLFADLTRAGLLQPRLDDGQGLKPAMGWSSWNVAQCDSASEEYALSAANLFLDLGLKDLGYTYINIDDCWSTNERNGSGNLVPDPDKWPNGIRAVADQIHDMGLKFGLYGDAGTMTCAGYPGSQDHEVQDAELLASWGIDFWKHDNCYTPCDEDPLPQTCWSDSIDTREWYGTMRDALESVFDVKPILFNICNWGRNDVWTWGYDYGHSWRIENDNWGDWDSVVRIGSKASGIAEFSGPGGFNDLDMLFVGNDVLTEAQERLHFGLWAICKSPLIIGADLAQISDTSLAILTNKGIIDINQDELGQAATAFQPPGQGAPEDGQIYPYWAGPLSDGVVIGLSAASGADTFSVSFADVPGLGDGSFNWQEMYSGQTGVGGNISFSLEEHDFAVVKVTTS